MGLGLAYSFSRIKAFDCPLRFKFLHLDKRKEPSGIPAIAGQIAHDMMARYLQWLYMEKDKTPANKPVKRLSMDALRASARAALDEAEYPSEFTSQDVQDVRDIIQKILSRLNMVPGGWLLPGIVGVEDKWIEQRMVFDKNWNRLDDQQWFKASGIFFRAIIDWAYIDEETQSLCIVDHKSGWGQPDERQLPYYAWTGLKGLCADRDDIKYVRVFFNTLPTATLEEVCYYTREDALELSHTIEKKVEEIENNTVWDAIPGESCKYCGFKNECPKMNKAWDDVAVIQRSEDSIQTKEDAEKAFQLYLLVSDRLSELKNQLETWVRKNGSISAAGKVMVEKEAKRWNVTKPSLLIKKLNDIGLPPADVAMNLGFSESSLKRVLKAGDAITHASKIRYMEELKQACGETEKKDTQVKILKEE